jgi:DNA topoisomerase-6 subunit B
MARASAAKAASLGKGRADRADVVKKSRPGGKKTPRAKGDGSVEAVVSSSPAVKAGNGKPATTPPDEAAPRERIVAEILADRQREISVSEFFAKNRHLLGFDNPTKALLTAVKEAVDNALDACEEARILPVVQIQVVQKAEDRFVMAVEDNGPGIVRAQIPNIFGKLLYGSKFHTLKMSRGQQGIGISAAGLYGQLTTGKPMRIWSRIAPKKPAHYFEILIDTNKNVPQIVKEEEVEWKKLQGTKVEIELEGRYQKGPKSVEEYVRLVALANPHAVVIYKAPDAPEPLSFERAAKQLPEEPKAIKPHPYGVELGVLIKMLQGSKARRITGALSGDFSRVSPRLAKEICLKAGIPENASPSRIAREEAEKLYQAIQTSKIMAPPTDCIAPIGEKQMEAALRQMFEADFYTTLTRPPSVYRGNPFQIEVGIAYGGKLPADELVELYRFANRVPLLYQQGACVITKTAMSIDWKTYGLQKSKGALPNGPAVLFVHMASVWVPFTSESKEAIAGYPEIAKEIKLGLQECGRRLAVFVHRRHRAAAEADRQRRFILYGGVLSRSLSRLTGIKQDKIQKDLSKVSRRAMDNKLEGMVETILKGDTKKNAKDEKEEKNGNGSGSGPVAKKGKGADE